MDLFNKIEYLRLIKNLEKIFLNLVQELELKSKNDNLAPFVGDLGSILGQKWCQFTKYHPVVFYFLSELQTFYLLVELYLEADEDSTEILFEELHQSSISSEFVALLDKLDERKAIEQSLLKYQDQLVGFFNNHLTKNPTLDYSIYPELGDQLIDGQVQTARFEKLTFEKLSLKIADTGISGVTKNVLAAIKIIKDASPKSFDRLRAFSKVIIPSDREEIVSYSSQYLPGYSVINMKHRDRLDLIDDLLHENGHHHLNYYLWDEELFEESPDEIFYSPWRENPRPLRGIYHGVFTFYFAQQIYFDLAVWTQQNANEFSEEERAKIYDRLVEESLMLETTFDDLNWAYKEKYIYKSGYALISMIMDKIKKNIEKFSELDKSQISRAQKKYEDLAKELKIKKKFYQKG